MTSNKIPQINYKLIKKDNNKLFHFDNPYLLVFLKYAKEPIPKNPEDAFVTRENNWFYISLI